MVKSKLKNVAIQPGEDYSLQAKAYAFETCGNTSIFTGIIYGISIDDLWERKSKGILSWPFHVNNGDDGFNARYIITDEIQAKKQIADIEWIKTVKSISKLYPKNSMHVIQYFRHKRAGQKTCCVQLNQRKHTYLTQKSPILLRRLTQ